MRKMIKFLLGMIFILSTFISNSLAADQVYFYHTDPVGTPMAISDANGQVVWRGDYKPFGEEASVSGALANDRKFVGKEKDEETGLYYFGARYLDAKIGRFSAVDPVRAVDPLVGKMNGEQLLDPQRLNYYAYSLNNPYKYVDFAGLDVTLNLFAKSDPLYVKAQKVASIPGVFTVGMHSSPVSFSLSGNQVNPSIAATVLANLIRSSPEWKKGMVVMLLGCNSGADPSAAINPKIKKMYANYASLAQRVADELGSPVEGASSFAWYHSNGYLPTVAPDANGTDWSTYKHGQSLKQSDHEQGYINFKPRNIQNN